MEKRHEELSNLQSYIQGVDREVAMILQSLQWDKKALLKGLGMVTCKYDATHKMPPDKKAQHETECFLKSQDYSKEDKMLSDPLDPNANGLLKLSSMDIIHIIEYATKTDPMLRKAFVAHNDYMYILFESGVEPLTLDRLQATYTADERRAIYDAVVSAAPSCHDLSDLALPSADEKRSKKSRLEIIAELRDMKRRRTKYRVAAKTKNYSDVLREVIKTQMEMYAEVTGVASSGDHSGTVIKDEHKYQRDRNNHRQVTVTRDIPPKADDYPPDIDMKHDKNYYREKYTENQSRDRTRESGSRDRKRDKDSLGANKYDPKDRHRDDHRHRKYDEYRSKSDKYSRDNRDRYFTGENRVRKRNYDESRYGRELSKTSYQEIKIKTEKYDEYTSKSDKYSRDNRDRYFAGENRVRKRNYDESRYGRELSKTSYQEIKIKIEKYDDYGE